MLVFSLTAALLSARPTISGREGVESPFHLKGIGVRGVEI